jgi:MFS transporter, UMF1 family
MEGSDIAADYKPEVVTELAPRKEILSWAMFDFANSGYSTVVATAIFNSYFVNTIAGQLPSGTATFLWTIAVAIANGLVVITAPILGSIADYTAAKKKFLVVSTLSCAGLTAILSLAGPGQVAMAMTLVILANFMYATGEDIIAAFLPEICPKDKMGKISAFGWTLGYIGGLLTLGICFAYIHWAEKSGVPEDLLTPHALLIVSIIFVAAAMPTFLFLKERAKPQPLPPGENYISIGFARLKHTIEHARRFEDLFRFLITLVLYSCGTSTVVVLASLYASKVVGFTIDESILLILVVNITAAFGAFVFGFVQDRFGSVPTLRVTLALWVAATLLAAVAQTKPMFWIAANLIGIAMGSSQSAGRALIGMFSPPGRSAEFFGLWGLAVKFASVIGPLVYGLITQLTGGNQRTAIISTVCFFIAGLIMLTSVNEQRGKAAAHNPE